MTIQQLCRRGFCVRRMSQSLYERIKRRRCRRNVRRDATFGSRRRTTTLDLGSPSRRGAIIRSSLIKLREMSKDSAMPARRTMRTQIITSLVVVSSYPRLRVCTYVYVSSVYILLALLYAHCTRLWNLYPHLLVDTLRAGSVLGHLQKHFMNVLCLIQETF